MTPRQRWEQWLNRPAELRKFDRRAYRVSKWAGRKIDRYASRESMREIVIGLVWFEYQPRHKRRLHTYRPWKGSLTSQDSVDIQDKSKMKVVRKLVALALERGCLDSAKLDFFHPLEILADVTD
jgi:hypothetical protein